MGRRKKASRRKKANVNSESCGTVVGEQSVAPGTQQVPVKLPDGTKFDFWIDEDGDPCLGNVCFNVKLDQKKRKILVRVKSGGTCPLKMDLATKALYQMFAEGSLETLYEIAQEKSVS